MPDWDSAVTIDPDQAPELRPFYEGEVVSAPNLISDRCMVTLRAFAPDQEFECIWTPRISTTGAYVKPAIGDTVLVAISDDEDAWIISFETSLDPVEEAPPIGPAGGYLGGTYPNPTVERARFNDSRNVATAPADYNTEIKFAFKARSAIGNPGTGTYAQLVGLHGWVDDSGGAAHELAFTNDGVYHRSGEEGTGWAPWNKLIEGNEPRLPTLDQKAALAGTVGTPSITNKYVTTEDFDPAEARLLLLEIGHSPSSGIFSVKAHGAVGNNVADDTSAIQSAIDACAAAGGGWVWFPPGIYRVGKLVVKHRVWLVGSGWLTSRLRLKTAVNDHMITNYVSSDGVEANAQSCAVVGLALDGNKAAQTGGTSHGIVWNQYPISTQATDDYDFDPHFLVQDVEIRYFRNDGYNPASRSENRVTNVWSHHNDGHGFVPNADSWMTDCTGSWNGKAGFYVSESPNKLASCKAFYNGQLDETVEDAGFAFKDTTGITANNLESQDNRQHGMYFGNCQRSTLSNVKVDSNSTSVVGDPGNSHAAIRFWDSSDNQINGATVLERLADGTNPHQRKGVSFGGTSAGNRVDMHFFDAAGLDAAAYVVQDQTGLNKVRANRDGCRQVIAYAASITPDPLLGNVFAVAVLTGNITVNAIAANKSWPGARLRFEFIQDATGGRTVTWNAAYKTNWTPVTTANKKNVIDFEYDGTNWIQVSDVVGL